MRYPNHPLWALWQKPGFLGGRRRPNCFVTVQPDWWLEDSVNVMPKGRTGALYKIFPWGPIRSFQRADNDQTEIVIPGVESISWDRTLDVDVASCTITFTNAQLAQELAAQDGTRLGRAGYFTPERGGQRTRRRTPPTSDALAKARWDHAQNLWNGQLVELALVRTYEGYGGWNDDGTRKTLQECLADGHVVKTGTWLIQEPDFSSAGEVVLNCLDMGDMLNRQKMYPPFMPPPAYPVRYARWQYVDKLTKVGETAVHNPVAARYRDSSGDRWYPDKIKPGLGAPIHGHYPAWALDGNPSSYWLSVGNSHPTRTFCTDWIEVDTGGRTIDGVDLVTWGGGYQVYVSVMVNGVWQGARQVPYDHSPLIGHQEHVVDTHAGVNYVAQAGAGQATSGTNFVHSHKMHVNLGRSYKAQRVRISMRQHQKTQWGPWFYRCGLYSLVPTISSKRAVMDMRETKVDGNYKDYSDIVKTLLLWSGWWLLPPAANGHKENKYPTVFGNIEDTGIYADEPLPAEMFDKVSPLEAITKLKEIVGYIFYIDEDGGAHFESPNWWSQGNFDEFGKRTKFIPIIDESRNLFRLNVRRSARNARSSIIISTTQVEPYAKTTVSTRRYPPMRSILRGMVSPAEWSNGNFLKRPAQERMAELIGLHSWFSLRGVTAQVVGNPLLSIDTQVRVFEEVTETAHMHYIRGVASTLSMKTGVYTADLTMNWLGDSDRWVFNWGGQQDTNGAVRRYRVPDNYETWNRLLRRIANRYPGTKFDRRTIAADNGIDPATNNDLTKDTVLEL